MTKERTLRKEDLYQFTGTSTWFRHGLNPSVLYTEGAQYIAEAGGAYWLLDTIAIMQHDRRVRDTAFQLWTLDVREDRTATLTCADGNYQPVHRQELDFTDFPLPSITLYFANGVIYLPSEH